MRERSDFRFEHGRRENFMLISGLEHGVKINPRMGSG
jgi:hypothetical protein